MTPPFPSTHPAPPPARGGRHGLRSSFRHRKLSEKPTAVSRAASDAEAGRGNCPRAPLSRRGPSLLLLALCIALPAAAHDLTATRLDDGTEIARLSIPEGAGWCILWNHSVKLFPVTDCYENRDGAMVLTRSHQPDFAAGLGHLNGRGTQTSDGAGGYWIEDIDEPVPGNAYILRPGGPRVDHRIRTATTTVSLSHQAARARVRIALED